MLHRLGPRPKLAWNFLATAAYEHLLPHFTAIHIWRTPELDFDLGERHFGVFAHDWRVESAVAWLVNTKASLTSITPVLKAPAELPPPLVLSQPEFEQAVRQALRDFVRPDQLAGNPLLRSQMLVNTTGATPAPADLQTILREAAGILAANSKDEKFIAHSGARTSSLHRRKNWLPNCSICPSTPIATS